MFQRYKSKGTARTSGFETLPLSGRTSRSLDNLLRFALRPTKIRNIIPVFFFLLLNYIFDTQTTMSVWLLGFNCAHVARRVLQRRHSSHVVYLNTYTLFYYRPCSGVFFTCDPSGGRYYVKTSLTYLSPPPRFVEIISFRWFRDNPKDKKEPRISPTTRPWSKIDVNIRYLYIRSRWRPRQQTRQCIACHPSIIVIIISATRAMLRKRLAHNAIYNYGSHGDIGVCMCVCIYFIGAPTHTRVIIICTRNTYT